MGKEQFNLLLQKYKELETLNAKYWKLTTKWIDKGLSKKEDDELEKVRDKLKNWERKET